MKHLFHVVTCVEASQQGRLCACAYLTDSLTWEAEQSGSKQAGHGCVEGRFADSTWFRLDLSELWSNFTVQLKHAVATLQSPSPPHCH